MACFCLAFPPGPSWGGCGEHSPKVKGTQPGKSPRSTAWEVATLQCHQLESRMGVLPPTLVPVLHPRAFLRAVD